mmetsp:Transcript_39576/g.60507  ORF Transcript_39576/g.60507 Transcript_39576/m.60507 type:complete len:120 (+) Transcript_39576:11146-11505(+)
MRDQEIQMNILINRMNQAIQFKNIGLMEDILKRYQGNLDHIQDDNGNSLLILSAMQGDFRMCDTLLTKGINGNIQNNIGNTALHFAIMKRYNKVIDTLISFGVNERIENHKGLLAWQMA